MRLSIRTTILAGCLSITLLTGLFGTLAQRTERKLAALAFDLYDNCFMSLSYLHEAQMMFGDFAAHPALATPAAMAELLKDLDIVRQRAPSERARSLTAQLQRDVAHVLPQGPSIRAAGAGIGSRDVIAAFDLLVQMFAADGFSYRQQVGGLVGSQLRHTNIALVVNILAALSITALLGQLISPPILRAVRAAQRIAAGDLETPVVVGGRGETADLLKALASMQASIAAAMARIRSLLDEQRVEHAGEIEAHSAKLAAALNTMTQGLCLFDADMRLLMANRRFAQMFGTPVIGAHADEVSRNAGMPTLPAMLRRAHPADQTSMTLDQQAASNELSRTGGLSIDLPDGRTVSIAWDQVKGGGWAATYEDITERRAAELRLHQAARHDALTGLGNRLTVSEHLQALNARPTKLGSVGVLCLNLDRFKLLNDTLGHAAGDTLLKTIAARLASAVAPSDLLARSGGDEFVIVQDTRDARREAARLAQRLITAVAAPIELNGQRVQIGASVGIAVAQDANATPETLLSCGDIALHQAKAGGRGIYHFFEPSMNLLMQARRALEQDLRGALAAGQLEVFYQPLVAATGGISGFEALLRWRHPARGMISPAEFISIAEEIGLIDEIGLWVLRRACMDCASWGHELKVAVNLSPAQFRGSALAQQVVDALADANLPPARLELEITESVLLQQDEHVILTLYDLRAQGVRIAMDDFGTGYSSLSYLRRFPFDKIKIDQSFVRHMCDKDDCRAIVRAVIGLGRSLGIAVNAEGVETGEQHAALMAEGCGELQGYLFSKPQPVEAVTGLLRMLGIADRAKTDAPRAMPTQPFAVRESALLMPASAAG